MRSPAGFAVAAALGAFAFLAAAAPSPARAADSAEECVRLLSTPVTKGVSLDVDNHCDRALSCHLSWTVMCENASGKTTRSRAGSAQLVVASSASGSAVASTSDCGDNWRVDDVRWACAPVK